MTETLAKYNAGVHGNRLTEIEKLKEVIDEFEKKLYATEIDDKIIGLQRHYLIVEIANVKKSLENYRRNSLFETGRKNNE